MSNPKSIWFFICAIASATVPAHADTAATRPTGLAGDVALVHASATRLEPFDGGTLITFEVSRVYAGSIIRAGDCYTAMGAADFGDFNGVSFSPRPKIGERGIWVVRSIRDHLSSTGLEPAFNYRFPAREGISPRYAECKVLAETVETVWKATPARRPALLRDSVFASTPEVSAWAVEALAQLAPEEVVRLSVEIASDGKIPVAGKVAVDEAMTGIDKKKWNNSADRAALLLGWADREHSEYDGWAIARRLNMASQHADPNDRVLLEAMGRTARNKTLPVEARRFIVQGLGVRAERDGTESLAATVLRSLSKELDEPELRAEADAWLLRTKQ